jgi:molecular chaperone DnaJ
MASRNYYLVLGVARNETQQGVRAAFRDLAKQWHPDRGGPAGASRFRELVKAYETLGDPARRHEYDESLQPRPRRTRDAGFVRNASLRRDFADVGPSPEALVGRIARNFSGVGLPKGEGIEELSVELAVSEEEAARGACVCLGIPVFSRCASCAGRGCSICAGQGVTESEYPVTISLPPMSGRGSTFVLPLSGLGIRNLFARVRVRVDKTVEPPKD